MTEFLKTPQGRRLAYLRQAGQGPGLVFLHGFNSDMRGTKGQVLADWAATQGRAFLRLDLSGHGESGGNIPDFGLSDWREDVLAVLDALTEGPQVLVGSSLGGWLALLVARSLPQRIAGVVTAAAAPDFTRRMEAEFTAADRAMLKDKGHVSRASDYGDDYVFSHHLLDQGRKESILDRPLQISAPVRMLYGTADADVPMADQLTLLDHIDGPDVRLTKIKGADHRLSDPVSLSLLVAAVADV
ncbi:alpha/beta fold hydrolase [Paracoccus suum]|uniref:Palmitoyl-protein thioesterase ABHD10, mitochondrial n=1 Tax=Paracoccus suum TaxID=2259340 RepID=A0A344PLB4_9RHOB|nr:alpha/beta fold hydrolase [Paracoccus suum]AXC50169.1 alpha/beta fold hydrolase [Paracoccus suum]